MKKSDLLRFIELYNLSGYVEKVKVESDGTKFSTKFITEDKTLFGIVSYEGLDVEKGEYSIHDTAQFRKMLNILDDDLTVTVNRLADGRAFSLTVSDKNSESLIMLADSSVIPKAPPGTKPFTVDLEIPLTPEFIQRFIRAKDALKDAKAFTLLPNSKTGRVELIIGYSGSINTNRVKLEINPVPGKDKLPAEISFNAEYFREILAKNMDSGTVLLKVASGGLAHAQFKTKEYEANYYLLKVTNV